MAMLAEKRQKVRYILNPRHSEWSKDTAGKFGHRLMEKMGWKAGCGLGSSLQGPTENVQISLKTDSRGLGFKGQPEDVLPHQDNFANLLAQLKSSVPIDEQLQRESLEVKSKQSKARVHYHKFTRSKDLSTYSQKDLECIVGKSSKVKTGTDSNLQVPKSINTTSNAFSHEIYKHLDLEMDDASHVGFGQSSFKESDGQFSHLVHSNEKQLAKSLKSNNLKDISKGLEKESAVLPEGHETTITGRDKTNRKRRHGQEINVDYVSPEKLSKKRKKVKELCAQVPSEISILEKQTDGSSVAVENVMIESEFSKKKKKKLSKENDKIHSDINMFAMEKSKNMSEVTTDDCSLIVGEVRKKKKSKDKNKELFSELNLSEKQMSQCGLVAEGDSFIEGEKPRKEKKKVKENNNKLSLNKNEKAEQITTCVSYVNEPAWVETAALKEGNVEKLISGTHSKTRILMEDTECNENDSLAKKKKTSEGSEGLVSKKKKTKQEAVMSTEPEKNIESAGEKLKKRKKGVKEDTKGCFLDINACEKLENTNLYYETGYSTDSKHMPIIPDTGSSKKNVVKDMSTHGDKVVWTEAEKQQKKRKANVGNENVCILTKFNELQHLDNENEPRASGNPQKKLENKSLGDKNHNGCISVTNNNCKSDKLETTPNVSKSNVSSSKNPATNHVPVTVIHGVKYLNGINLNNLKLRRHLHYSKDAAKSIPYWQRKDAHVEFPGSNLIHLGYGTSIHHIVHQRTKTVTTVKPEGAN